MHESFQQTEPYSAFIWYHADADLSRSLQAWVADMGKRLKVRSHLLVRNEQERTTFMEIYEGIADNAEQAAVVVSHIETCATQQTCCLALDSPRRAEVFARAGD